MAILLGGPWSTLVYFNPLFEECSINQIGLIFSASIGHPANDVHIMLNAYHFKKVFGGCNGCGFGAQCHSPGMRGEIIIEGDNVLELPV